MRGEPIATNLNLIQVGATFSAIVNIMQCNYKKMLKTLFFQSAPINPIAIRSVITLLKNNDGAAKYRLESVIGSPVHYLIDNEP